MKRILSLLLIAAMLLVTVSALAESWTCPDCGRRGNTGSFCPDCGASKPVSSVPAVINNSKIKAGDYVRFGHYEQDNNEINGKESIQWLVLDVKGDYAFLYSRHVLDHGQFNENSAGQTWANSTLRAWLNDTFYYLAFSYDERKYIQDTQCEEGVETCYSQCAPKRTGPNTVDKVFLPSYAEIIKFLPTKNDRMCYPTDYALKRGANKSKKVYSNGRTSWYWLRSPAYANNALVVDWDGTVESAYISHPYGTVRPAIWVDINGLE